MKVNALLLSVILIGVTVAADDPPADEKKAFEGTWSLVSLEVNGNSIGDSVRAAGLRVEFSNNTVTFKTKDTMVTGTFKLGAVKDLKTIETTVKNEVEKGIYAFDGKDTLKLCVSKAGDAAPTEFKTKDGDGKRLFVYKREAPKAPKDK